MIMGIDALSVVVTGLIPVPVLGLTAIWLAQLVPGVDPTPFTAWGVLGLLGVVIIVLVGVIWKLFVRQSSSMEARDQILMSFVDRHRSETTVALDNIANKVTASNDRVTAAFAKQARALDEILFANRVLDQVEKRIKAQGVAGLDDTMIEKIVRSVIHERSGSKE